VAVTIATDELVCSTASGKRQTRIEVD